LVQAFLKKWWVESDFTVPGSKLLLESDSPHLHDVAGSVNHPAHLFRVAEEVLPMREPCTGGSREIGPRGRIGGGKRGMENS
jgi:hypothetical protein